MKQGHEQTEESEEMRYADEEFSPEKVISTQKSQKSHKSFCSPSKNPQEKFYEESKVILEEKKRLQENVDSVN